jgi:hypothetical protein
MSGENVREFFFRVAALTFEANVLAELEKSGARHIADVVRKLTTWLTVAESGGGVVTFNPWFIYFPSLFRHQQR